MAEDKRTYSTFLIAAGVAAWIPYAVGKYLLGYQLPIMPFLFAHLSGVLPGGYLRFRERKKIKQKSLSHGQQY